MNVILAVTMNVCCKLYVKCYAINEIEHVNDFKLRLPIICNCATKYKCIQVNFGKMSNFLVPNDLHSNKLKS